MAKADKSGPPPPGNEQPAGEAGSLPPNTTVQQDKIVEGQRSINQIWEHNQARIAWLVVVVTVIANALLVIDLLVIIFVESILNGKDVTANQMALLLASLGTIAQINGIIIGFYFSRTNHVNTGGVGPKTNEHR